MTFRCTLGDDALAAQADAWRQLAGFVISSERWGSGFRLTFDGAVRERVVALVATEQGCCSWARWEVRGAGGAVELEVTGPRAEIAGLAGVFGL
jgi:hypothetical protein